MRDKIVVEDKECARKMLGFNSDDFLVCSFGILGPTKLNHRLLRAWLKSSLSQDKRCYLVFVGENNPGFYGKKLIAEIIDNKAKNNIRITGWVTKEQYNQYLSAADLGVQLRTLSRGETSAAVLDCMNYGLATIINANGSLADIDENSVWKLSDTFNDDQLIEALQTLWKDNTRRHQLSKAARDIILNNHNPKFCAKQYAHTIEKFYQSAASGLPALPRAIANNSGDFDNTDLIRLAKTIACSFYKKNRRQQLFLDISILLMFEIDKAIIKNIIHDVITEFIRHSQHRYRIEPVYSSCNHGYLYARSLTLESLGCPKDEIQDEIIDYTSGDVFLSFDKTTGKPSEERQFFQKLRRQGVKVLYVVNEVLSQDTFEMISERNYSLNFSKTLSNELVVWINQICKI